MISIWKLPVLGQVFIDDEIAFATFTKTYKAKQVRYGTSLRKVINQTRARYIRIFLEIVFMCLLYTRCYHICSMTNHCYSHYYFYVFNANKSNFACTKTILIYNWRRSNQVISFVVWLYIFYLDTMSIKWIRFCYSNFTQIKLAK